MTDQRRRFQQKVCFVTGGGSGIGRAVCLQFAREGGKIAILDLDEAGGRTTEGMVAAEGGEGMFVPADVANSVEILAAVAAVIKKWHRIDVLVNNAGIMTFDRVAELEEAAWERVLAVNLRSVFLCCKYCLPHIKGGSIVNVSSVHGHRTQAGVASYAASKGGMEAFSRSLRCEYAPAQVRINCVAPGGVDTPMLWSNPAIKALERSQVVCASPERVAAVVCFLASEEASAIHGAVVPVDQGLLAAL